MIMLSNTHSESAVKHSQIDYANSNTVSHSANTDTQNINIINEMVKMTSPTNDTVRMAGLTPLTLNDNATTEQLSTELSASSC